MKTFQAFLEIKVSPYLNKYFGENEYMVFVFLRSWKLNKSTGVQIDHRPHEKHGFNLRFQRTNKDKNNIKGFTGLL